MKKKNILILSYSDSRGDGIATYNFAKMLIQEGHDVRLMALNKSRSDAFIIQPILNSALSKNILYRIINKILNKIKVSLQKEVVVETNKKYDFFVSEEFSKLVSADSILSALPFKPDVIFVGAMSDFVNTTTLSKLSLKTGASVHLLMHDMFPITGGCQHAWDCKGYENDCGNCPAIVEEKYKDLARKNLQRKLENVRKSDINVIAGSGRTHEQAKKSTLFKNQNLIHTITNFIDCTIYNGNHRSYAKALFNLPHSSKVIFTGVEHADIERKGINYFIEALQCLWEGSNEEVRTNTIVLIAGKNIKDNNILYKIPFKKHLVEFITDDRYLSLVYQAADVFVCSSIEDPGPVTVSQALACGTPVVGFEMGALYNMVENDFDGYKARLRDSRDLAKGIYRILNLSKDEFDKYSLNAINQVEQFASQEAALRTLNKIIDEHEKGSHTSI